jgi:putative transposase
MSQYKRCYQSGRNYFFTLVTYQRRPLFSSFENVKHFKIAINKVKKKYPFSLNAIVILPDHLHCLWKMPGNDSDFSMRWRLIKRYFSIEMEASINHRKEKEVWQRRFWEHAIRDEDDRIKHMNYIHYNPVKHDLAQSPGDWEHSSFNYWVEKGVYEKDWGSMKPIVFAGMNEAE